MRRRVQSDEFLPSSPPHSANAPSRCKQKFRRRNLPPAATEIFAYNVMEHLPNVVATMEEIHRIGRDDALVHIKTPHFAGLESWEDPTHVHHLSLESFDYFSKGSRHVGHYSKSEFRVVEKKLHFGGNPMSQTGRLLCWLSPRKYEKRWAFIFRPIGMEIHLAIVKP